MPVANCISQRCLIFLLQAVCNELIWSPGPLQAVCKNELIWSLYLLQAVCKNELRHLPEMLSACGF